MNRIWRTGALLVLTLLMAAASPGEAPAARFAPPDERVIVTRTLWRPLQEGGELMVLRSYAVTFRPTRDGYRAEGHLLTVEVDAPQELEPVAAIERARRFDDPFPIALDRAGQITAVTTNPGEAGVRAQGTKAMLEVLARRHLDPERMRAAEAFLSALAKKGTGNTWPLDLFNPASDRTQTDRRLELATAGEGQVSVVTQVHGRFPGGMPREFDRAVTTSIAGKVSTGRERWTIAPASGPG